MEEDVVVLKLPFSVVNGHLVLDSDGGVVGVFVDMVVASAVVTKVNIVGDFGPLVIDYDGKK